MWCGAALSCSALWCAMPCRAVLCCAVGCCSALRCAAALRRVCVCGVRASCMELPGSVQAAVWVCCRGTAPAAVLRRPLEEDAHDMSTAAGNLGQRLPQAARESPGLAADAPFLCPLSFSTSLPSPFLWMCRTVCVSVCVCVCSCRVCSEGMTGDELVQALAANSISFDSKTAFAQVGA